MISANFSETPLSMPRRLFSARVARKFLTVSLAAPPICFCSSATMAPLSASVSVGVSRMTASLASLAYRALRALSARAVGSRDEDLTAAVYCIDRK